MSEQKWSKTTRRSQPATHSGSGKQTRGKVRVPSKPLESTSSTKKAKTAGDRLLSSLKMLEDVINAGDDDSGSSSSPIWKTSMPLLAADSSNDLDPDNYSVRTPSYVSLAAESLTVTTATPTKGLVDKFDNLSQTWSAVKSVASSSSTTSKKNFQNFTVETPRHSKLFPMQSNNSRSGREGRGSVIRPENRARQLSHQQHHGRDQQGDEHSVGDSTISTISSGSESVFDRLYRMGLESSQKRKQQHHDALTSPLSQTPNFSFDDPLSSSRRHTLSYTPKSTGRLISPKATSGLTPAQKSIASNKKNRLSAITETQSLASLRRRQSTSAIPTASSSRSVRSAASSVSSRKGPPALSTSTTAGGTSQQMEKPDQTQADVFSRLHRNEKRSMPLWKQPSSNLPVHGKASIHRQQQGRHIKGAHPNLNIDTTAANSEIDTADATPTANNKAVLEPSPTPTTSLTPTTVDDELQLLDELLADNTPKSMNLETAKNNFSTEQALGTTIPNVSKIVPSSQNPKKVTRLNTTALKVSTTGSDAIQSKRIEGEKYSLEGENSLDSLDEDLAELNRIRQSLKVTPRCFGGTPPPAKDSADGTQQTTFDDELPMPPQQVNVVEETLPKVESGDGNDPSTAETVSKPKHESISINSNSIPVVPHTNDQRTGPQERCGMENLNDINKVKSDEQCSHSLDDDLAELSTIVHSLSAPQVISSAPSSGEIQQPITTFDDPLLHQSQHKEVDTTNPQLESETIDINPRIPNNGTSVTNGRLDSISSRQDVHSDLKGKKSTKDSTHKAQRNVGKQETEAEVEASRDSLDDDIIELRMIEQALKARRHRLPSASSPGDILSAAMGWSSDDDLLPSPQLETLVQPHLNSEKEGPELCEGSTTNGQHAVADSTEEVTTNLGKTGVKVENSDNTGNVGNVEMSRDSLDDDLSELRMIEQTLNAAKHTPSLEVNLSSLKLPKGLNTPPQNDFDSTEAPLNTEKSVRDRSKGYLDSSANTLMHLRNGLSNAVAKHQETSIRLQSNDNDKSRNGIEAEASCDSLDNDLAELRDIANSLKSMPPSLASPVGALSTGADEVQKLDLEKCSELKTIPKHDETAVLENSEPHKRMPQFNIPSRNGNISMLSESGSGFFTLDENNSLASLSWTRNNGVDSENKNDTGEIEQSIANSRISTDSGNAMTQHRSATVIQNWFRLNALKSALDSSTATQEELQVALTKIASPDQRRTRGSELQDARRLLKQSSSFEDWLDPCDPTPNAFRQWVTSSTDDWIEKRAATLAIHNIVRAYLMGLRRYRRNRKAVSIQAAWRQFRQRRQYQQWRRSAVLIQMVWGDYRFDKQQHESATCIQAAWRTALVLREWQSMKFSTTIIQSVWRKELIYRRYQAMRQIAIWTQRIYHGAPKRKEFLQLRSAVSSLQTLQRIAVRKKLFAHQLRTSILIQRWWRGASQYRKWSQILLSTIFVQKVWRRVQANSLFRDKRQAVIKVQRIWRGYTIRAGKIRQDFAATQIQAQWRRFAEHHKHLLRLKGALTIERVYRAFRSRKRVSLPLLRAARKDLAATTINTAARRLLMRIRGKRTLLAVLRVQANVRSRQQKHIYVRTLSRIVVLQSEVRAVLQRRGYMRQRNNAILLQSTVRGMIARAEFCYSRISAIMIQATWRGHMQRLLLWRQRSGVIELQRIVRGFVARRKRITMLHSATRAQAIVRRLLVKRSVLRMATSAHRIQKLWRTAMFRETIRQMIVTKHKAACFIQSCWRAHVALGSYREKREACVVIQSAARCHVQRLEYLGKRQAATVIQACYRRSRAMSEFSQVLRSVLQIQCHWRLSQARDKYMLCRASVIMIQAAARLFLIRRSMTRSNAAAVHIQGQWRCYHQRKKYVVLRGMRELYQSSRRTKASRRIQRQFRRVQLLRQHSSATTVQRQWRGMKVRKLNKLYFDCACVIQKEVRRHQAQNSFHLKRAALTLIQSHLRGSLVRSKVIRSRIVGACVRIEAAYRGFQQRKMYMRTHSQIVILQSLVRGKLQRLSYQRQLASIVVLQSTARGMLARAKFGYCRISAIMIQATWRGFFQRLLVQRQNLGVTEFQRVARGFLARREVMIVQKHCKIDAACSIQSCWRAHVALGSYREKREACVVIQSAARCRMQRLEYLGKRQAATMIQACYRRSRAMSEFSQVLRSVLQIQCHWRLSQARDKYMLCRASVIMIQAAARSFLLRRSMTRSNAAAVHIQGQWRCYHQRKKYVVLRGMRELYQSSRRTKASRRIQRQFRRVQLLRQHSSATTVQRQWRGMKVRKLNKLYFDCACVIQKEVRRHQAQNSFHLKRAALTLIQSHLRGSLVRSKVIRSRIVGACVRIEAAYRGFQQRKMYMRTHSQIVILQSLVRGKLQRLSYQRQLASIVVLQSTARGMLARAKFGYCRISAIMIQATWRGFFQRLLVQRQNLGVTEFQRVARGFLARREVMIVQKHCKIDAACSIQTCWRAHVALGSYREKREACVVIQSAARCRMQRLEYLGKRQAATMIQACYRRSRAMSEFSQVLRSVLQIQCHWRLSQARDKYMLCRASVIMIQAAARSFLLRRSMTRSNAAAVHIQGQWRCYHQRKKYVVLRGMRELYQSSRRTKASRRIQRQFRRVQLLRQHSSATTVQRQWRGIKVRKLNKLYFDCACVIQKEVRRHQAQNSFHLKRAALTLIQSHLRGSLVRSKVIRSRIVGACVRIEAAYRGFQQRKMYMRTHSQIVILQSLVRGKLQRLSYQRQLASIVVLQSTARGMLARAKFGYCRISAIMIQATWRGFFQRLLVQRQNLGVTEFQRVARGFLARREVMIVQKHCKIDAACSIQTCWRAHVALGSYREKREACVVIQSAARCRMQRLEYLGKRQAATVIQACYRRSRAVSEFSQVLRSVLQIQCHWRLSQARDKYMLCRASVIMIQAAARLFLIRRSITRSNAAAVHIQGQWRCYHQRKKYVVLRGMRELYQSSRRTKASRRIQRQFRRVQLLRQHSSATTVQRQWRGMKVRKLNKMYFDCACVIQKEVRRHQAQNSFHLKRAALTLIQSHLRGSLVRSKVTRSRIVGACVRIEAAYRGFQQRKMYMRTHSQIVILQSLVRGKLQRLSYQRQLASIVVLQRTVRAIMESRRYELWVLSVQNMWRCYAARRRFLYVKSSTVRLQAWVRMMNIRIRYWYLRQPKDIRQSLQVAARKIQFAYLLWKMRLAVWEMQSSAVILQRSMRGQLVRSAARFALCHMNSSIQSAPRSLLLRTAPSSNRNVLSTMATWDRAVGRAKITAAIVIQGAVRRMLARNFVLSKFGVSFDNDILEHSFWISENESAIVIQRAFFSWKGRRQIAAMELQRIARAVLATRKYHQLAQAKALMTAKRVQVVLDLQNAFRSRERRLSATLDIQRFAWGVLAMQEIQKMVHARTMVAASRNKAASVIQQVFRAWTERRLAATYQLQRLALNVIARRSYRELMNAEVLVDSLKSDSKDSLGKPVRKKSITSPDLYEQTIDKMLEVQIRESTVPTGIQPLSWTSEKPSEKHGAAASKIQAWIRMLFAASAWRETRAAAILIQACYRRYNALCQVTMMQLSQFESTFLQQYVMKIELESQMLTDSLLNQDVVSVSPCVERLALHIRSSIDERNKISKTALPRYIDELKELDAITSKTIQAPTLSPKGGNTLSDKKVLTPVRSNKTLSEDGATLREESNIYPLSEPAADLARQAQDLLKAGREAKRSKELFVPFLPLRATPQQELLENRSDPGESFFQTDDKELPSPIKLDNEDWDWANKW